LAGLQGNGSTLSLTVVLDGEYGHRGIALTVPARLVNGRIERVVEIALQPIDRVALDRAASRP
jgi:malate/lactate dehydrogenase